MFTTYTETRPICIYLVCITQLSKLSTNHFIGHAHSRHMERRIRLRPRLQQLLDVKLKLAAHATTILLEPCTTLSVFLTTVWILVSILKRSLHIRTDWYHAPGRGQVGTRYIYIYVARRCQVLGTRYDTHEASARLGLE